MWKVWSSAYVNVYISVLISSGASWVVFVICLQTQARGEYFHKFLTSNACLDESVKFLCDIVLLTGTI